MIVLILKEIIFNVKESKKSKNHSFVLYIPTENLFTHSHVAAGNQTQGLGVLNRYYISKYILSALTEAWHI